MNNKLTIISLLITLILALKQGEIGQNDWHRQNIGQISFLQLVKNKLFFLSQMNVLGYLNAENGQIQTRIALSSNQVFLSRSQKQVTFITGNNQIISYKTQTLQRSVSNRFVNDKLLKSIISYVHTAQGKVLINDQKNIRSYKIAIDDENQFVEVYVAQPDEIIQKVFNFDEKTFFVSRRGNLLLVRQVINDKTTDVISQLQTQDTLSGWNVRQIWQAHQKLVVLLQNQDNEAYETFVLDSNFKPIFRIAKKYGQVLNDQLLFCSVTYNLKQSKQTTQKILLNDESLNIQYSLVASSSSLTLLKSSQQYIQVAKPSHLKVKKQFLLQKSSFSHFLIVQYCDMTVQTYFVEKGVYKHIWTRQEALAYVGQVLFMKYPYNDHLDNEYHRGLQDKSYKQMDFFTKLLQVPQTMAIRINSEIKDLIKLILQSVQSLTDFSKLSNFDIKQFAKFKMSQEQQLKLGLRKYILIVTTKGTIYSIDTKSNKILWKKSRSLKNQVVISFLRLHKSYQQQSAILCTFNTQTSILSFQQITQSGQILPLQTFHCSQLPTIHKLTQDSLIIKHGQHTINYQFGEHQEQEKHFYFYTQEEKQVVGWKQQVDGVVQIWNFQLDQNQKVISTASAYKGQHASRIPLLDNGKVIFKNVDYTNLAILTSKNATSMSLYIINGITGQVHFNEYKSGLNLNHPVNLAYDQNNVIVSYYNNRNKLYQIWTVQEYQQRIQTSAISMITDYLQGEQYKPSRNRQNIIFLSQVYGSPVSIKSLSISSSKSSLIRRNLIILTLTNKLYSISRQLISTRRPKQTAFFSNQAYPPYQYALPYEANKFYSYNLDLVDLRKVHFSSSDMESTIFVIVYGGLDLFVVRIAPDTTFDMIMDDFNYLVLLAIIIFVTIAVAVLRAKAIQARLIKPHRD